MDRAAGSGKMLHFSTADLPPAERLVYLVETYGRACLHLEIDPRSDQPVQQSARVLVLPGLNVMWSRSSSPMRWSRTREVMTDGCDNLYLSLPLAGSMRYFNSRRDIGIEENAGVCLLTHEPGSVEAHRLDVIGMMVPRAALAGLVRNVEDAATRVIPATNAALRLLRSYLTLLHTGDGSVNPELAQVVVPHIYDLMALAVGATREGTELARGRGVRAARLKAIKDDLIADPSLSLTTMAERQGVTPRYVQLLFEADGTTFTAYALDQHLSRAHRLLVNPRYGYWTVSAIAFEAGFGDLSHFNRNFRRRYGASPSEVRAEALRRATAS